MFGLLAQVFDGGGLTQGLNEAEAGIEGSGIRTDADFTEAVIEIVNFALTFAAIFAFIAFVVSGFMFILGFGSDASIQRARKIMIWSAVGLLVILFSFVITDFIVELGTAAS